MKYYLLEGRHLAPFEEFKHMEPEHHAFLQKGYDQGHFLFSGPWVPPRGGVLVARAESREALDSFLAQEPFVKAGKMRFIRVEEFFPAQCHSSVKAWFS